MKEACALSSLLVETAARYLVDLQEICFGVWQVREARTSRLWRDLGTIADRVAETGSAGVCCATYEELTR